MVSLGLSALQYQMFWEHTSRKEKQASLEKKKKLIVDQLLQHVKTEATSYRNVFS
jgi:hypothetical protein